MKELTNRQRKLLYLIYEYYERKGYPPTIQELAQLDDVNCNGVYGRLHILTDKGYLTRDANKSRSMMLTDKALNEVRRL